MVVQRQWWCPLEEYADVQDNWFVKFFETGCAQFQDMDASKIEVYSVFGNHGVWAWEPSNDNVVRFLFVGENQSFSTDHPWYPHLDAILTFFYDTPKSIRCPLWMTYWRFDMDGLFVSPSSIPRMDRAVIVVSHDNTGNRNAICQKVLREYGIPIDSSKPCVSHTHLISAPKPGVKNKLECIQQYRYNICPENSYRPGYVTEKVFQSLAGGCVPIYWGHFPVEPSILHQGNILNIHEPFRSGVDLASGVGVWTPDAIVHIFATYLKVWSVAVRKLGGRRRRSDVATMEYHCHTMDECLDTLATHWRMYQRFWHPRPTFQILKGRPMKGFGSDYRVDRNPVLNSPIRRIEHRVEMEELADPMYERYRTVII